MISKKIEQALNKQIELEAESSFIYLAMASWCDINGYEGASKFLYGHSDEERQHMLRLFRYINDKGGHALVPKINAVTLNYESLHSLFIIISDHEEKVTKSINELVSDCLAEKDHSTYTFLQWYVNEQNEEERLFKSILDKFKLMGDDGTALYWMDKDLAGLASGEGLPQETVPPAAN